MVPLMLAVASPPHPQAKPSLLRPRYEALAPAAQASGLHSALGVVDHGLERAADSLPADLPFAQILMEHLGGSCGREIWMTDTPLLHGEDLGIRYAHSGDVMFGVMRADPGPLRQSTQDGYRAILNLIHKMHAGHLIRIWHYFPEINQDSSGLERYKQFCQGRHEALSAGGFRLADDLPAASAVGTAGGDLWLLFLAGTGRVQQIENPRQTSAFRYPPAYGPSSPAFSRAVRYTTDRQDLLFISGTASIVGHETIHPSDPALQAVTTLDNLQALLHQVTQTDLAALGEQASWKLFIRHPEHLPHVLMRLRTRLDPASPLLILKGDICRSALLLEIEGVIDLRALPGKS